MKRLRSRSRHRSLHCFADAERACRRGGVSICEATSEPAKRASREHCFAPAEYKEGSKVLAMPCLKAIIFLAYTSITLIFIDLAIQVNGWTQDFGTFFRKKPSS